MLIKQISVFLENNKGTLRTLTKLLAEKEIDILALSIADTTDFGIIRMLVREKDIASATSALRDSGFVAKTNNVICVAVPNKPAGLDGVLSVIEEENLSIEYMYSLNYIIGNKALLVLKLSADNMEKEQIAGLLKEKDVVLITQEEINKL